MATFPAVQKFEQLVSQDRRVLIDLPQFGLFSHLRLLVSDVLRPVSQLLLESLDLLFKFFNLTVVLLDSERESEGAADVFCMLVHLAKQSRLLHHV